MLIKFIPVRAIENIEDLGINLSQILKDILKENDLGKWVSSFQNFFRQINQYSLDKEDIGRLAIHNFKNATKYLSKIHISFEKLFDNSPDYFEARRLNLQEIESYSKLSDYLEVWILEKPKYLSNAISQHIQSKKDIKHQELLEHLKIVSLSLGKNEIVSILPNNIYIDHPRRYLPIAFSVSDPCHPEINLFLVIEAVLKIIDISDYFCFIPTFEGKRFLERGYQISSQHILELLDGKIENWETLALHELPEGIWHCLPEIEFCPNYKQQFRSNIYGLIGGLEILMKYQTKTEFLKDSQNPFKIALYDNQIIKSNNLIQELRNLIVQVKEQLKYNFLTQKSNKNYLTIREFLESLEIGLSQNNLQDNSIVNSEELINIVDCLLTESTMRSSA